MLKKIKAYIPLPIKNNLIWLYEGTIAKWNKRSVIIQMQRKHAELLVKIKNKNQIRVVFLVIHKSVWKVDPVFRKMMADPFFDPIVLVCPYISYDEECMRQEMRQCVSYFKDKGYQTYSAYNEVEGRWLELSELNPDIIFFTNPHNLTLNKYYKHAYLNYLSCYVPYFILTTTHGGDHSIYNQVFHNCMWKIFMPHEFSMVRARAVSEIGGANCELTGYPACEVFNIKDINRKKAWKQDKKKRKKIIFAPHHSVKESALQLSNFLIIGYKMIEYAEKYKDEVQWSFKPHPILRYELYNHPLWGRERTDLYYEYWSVQEFTQYDDGEYADLFLESDAIIHDSGSFIAEYLFMMKPCAYIVMNGSTQMNSINEFGKMALDAYVKIEDFAELEGFIIDIKDNNLGVTRKHSDFHRDYIHPFYFKNNPSDSIVGLLRSSILGCK